jgi:DNA-binding winged helix-turn-helix (wHTH) protein
MIPKSGYRFSEKIMLKQKSMIPKSGYRFSEKIMLKRKAKAKWWSEPKAIWL